MISTAGYRQLLILLSYTTSMISLIQEKKLEPRHLWNCDESGFPTDPARCKVVSTKGEVAYNPGRESIEESMETMVLPWFPCFSMLSYFIKARKKHGKHGII